MEETPIPTPLRLQALKEQEKNALDSIHRQLLQRESIEHNLIGARAALVPIQTKIRELEPAKQ
jgi:hypothetical protein